MRGLVDLIKMKQISREEDTNAARSITQPTLHLVRKDSMTSPVLPTKISPNRGAITSQTAAPDQSP